MQHSSRVSGLCAGLACIQALQGDACSARRGESVLCFSLGWVQGPPSPSETTQTSVALGCLLCDLRGMGDLPHRCSQPAQRLWHLMQHRVHNGSQSRPLITNECCPACQSCFTGVRPAGSHVSTAPLAKGFFCSRGAAPSPACRRGWQKMCRAPAAEGSSLPLCLQGMVLSCVQHNRLTATHAAYVQQACIPGTEHFGHALHLTAFLSACRRLCRGPAAAEAASVQILTLRDGLWNAGDSSELHAERQPRHTCPSCSAQHRSICSTPRQSWARTADGGA